MALVGSLSVRAALYYGGASWASERQVDAGRGDATLFDPVAFETEVVDRKEVIAAVTDPNDHVFNSYEETC